MSRFRADAIDHTQVWLHKAVELLDKEFFDGHGYALPKKLRCSCGFPKGKGDTIGQCWNPALAADETTHMFISPVLDDPIQVLATLLHEMIHAVLGTEEGHGKTFKKLMKEFGLVGKATATYCEPGTDLHRKLSSMVTKLGKYPHKALVPRTKEGTGKSMGGWLRYRSINEDKYRVVVSPKMVEEHGAPRDPWGDEMQPVE